MIKEYLQEKRDTIIQRQNGEEVLMENCVRILFIFSFVSIIKEMCDIGIFMQRKEGIAMEQSIIFTNRNAWGATNAFLPASASGEPGGNEQRCVKDCVDQEALYCNAAVVLIPAGMMPGL